MKSVKRAVAFALIFIMALSLAGQGSDAATKKPKLNKKKISLYVGKTKKLKVKNTKQKVKWSSSKKSVATVSKKGKVKAKKKGKATITAKVAKKKLKCKVTVKEKVVYSSVTVENFESYEVNTDWDNYTLGEGLTSGGNEDAHYLADGETMKVIKDPEDSSNQVLQVIPKFYSFCPVFTVYLEKLTGVSSKKLGDYKGIRVKVRVVSDASRHVGIGINAFFGKEGTINKKYAFNTYTAQENAYPAEREYYKFYYTKGMVTPETSSDGDMPQEKNGKSQTRHKYKESAKNVGFATKTLLFNSYLTSDLRTQTSFDFVVGGSYGKANGEYLAWYIDDVQLIY